MNERTPENLLIHHFNKSWLGETSVEAVVTEKFQRINLEVITSVGRVDNLTEQSPQYNTRPTDTDHTSEGFPHENPSPLPGLTHEYAVVSLNEKFSFLLQYLLHHKTRNVIVLFTETATIKYATELLMAFEGMYKNGLRLQTDVKTEAMKEGRSTEPGLHEADFCVRLTKKIRRERLTSFQGYDVLHFDPPETLEAYFARISDIPQRHSTNSSLVICSPNNPSLISAMMWMRIPVDQTSFQHVRGLSGQIAKLTYSDNRTMLHAISAFLCIQGSVAKSPNGTAVVRREELVALAESLGLPVRIVGMQGVARQVLSSSRFRHARSLLQVSPGQRERGNRKLRASINIRTNGRGRDGRQVNVRRGRPAEWEIVGSQPFFG